MPVLCPFSAPCQIITPLVEIAIWLLNPNPTPNLNPFLTPNPKPTNTRGVIIWQGSELGTTPVTEQKSIYKYQLGEDCAYVHLQPDSSQKSPYGSYNVQFYNA